MAKCPKCQQEIDRLDVMVTERVLYGYDGSGDFDRAENIEFDIDYWKCPLCHTRLDLQADTDAADEFLGIKQGGD